jgi:Spy/CpxP family protein refolding chaperone
MQTKSLPVICLVMALILGVGVGYVKAQDLPGGKWWRTPRAIKSLNLSEGEIKRLDEAYRDSRRKMIPLKGRVEAEQFELETLMEVDPVDEKALMAQYQKLETARVNLGMERFAFLVQVRKIVGRHRFEELVRFKKAIDRKKRDLPAPNKDRPRPSGG